MIFMPETEEIREPLPAKVDCPECQGRGRFAVNVRRDPETNAINYDERDCLACEGTGQVPGEDAVVCERCATITKWKGQHCVAHDDQCDECRPRGCGDCADQ